MKKNIQIGDSFEWVDGSRITIKNIRTVTPNRAKEQLFLFHEISCEWSYIQLRVLNVIK